MRAVDNAKSFYFQDSIGSTIALTDSATGGVNRSYSYDPLGGFTTAGAGQEALVRFAGGHFLTNPGPGLYHFGARYYLTSTGRWTQPDPFDQYADLQEANRYAYAGGDPANFIDPYGTSISGWARAFGRIGPWAGLYCYVRRAASDSDNSWTDEARDVNSCFNPFSYLNDDD
jgi:RHS repeat-associated protein